MARRTAATGGVRTTLGTFSGRRELPWQPDKIRLRLPGRVSRALRSCLAGDQSVVDCGRQPTVG